MQSGYWMSITVNWRDFSNFPLSWLITVYTWDFYRIHKNVGGLILFNRRSRYTQGSDNYIVQLLKMFCMKTANYNLLPTFIANIF